MYGTFRNLANTFGNPTCRRALIESCATFHRCSEQDTTEGMSRRTGLLLLLLVEWALAAVAAKFAYLHHRDVANFEEAFADCEKVLTLVGSDPEKKELRDTCSRITSTVPARIEKAHSQERSWTICAIAFAIGGAGVLAFRARQSSAESEIT